MTEHATPSHFERQTIRTDRPGMPPRYREVYVPDDITRFWHDNVLRFLYKKEFATNHELPGNTWVSGAMPGSQVIDGVLPHRHNKRFYKLDLKDAFPSVDRPLLRRKVSERAAGIGLSRSYQEFIEYFMDNYAFPEDAPGLALGPPASPYLFNVYAMEMDATLASFAAHHDLTYTRFLDDITLSSPFSAHILGEKMRRTIRDIIENTPGMTVNHAKSHVHIRDKRPVEITGMAIHRDGSITPNAALMQKVKGAFDTVESHLASGAIMSMASVGLLDGYHGVLASFSTEPYRPEVAAEVDRYRRVRYLTLKAMQMAEETPREKPSADKIQKIESLLLDALHGDEYASIEVAINVPDVWNVLVDHNLVNYSAEPLFKSPITTYTRQQMLTILLHSSKTMLPVGADHVVSSPEFLAQAQELQAYLSRLTPLQLEKIMHISGPLAEKTAKLTEQWAHTKTTTPVVETFRGDIYSGLRALEWTAEERSFAQDHLRVLSGLYGILKPYDGIAPYRLEAGYRLPDEPYKNLYRFWGERLAETLPKEGPIVNVASAEYEKLIIPHVDPWRVITPKFLSRVDGGEPKFVAVHAKIARGALARWLIRRGENSAEGIEEFSDLGYEYREELSLPEQPVFVCEEFKGIGLSQRLI